MKQQREHWGSKLGFIMATAGSAIGLGSLWRFPYVTGNNGGGAFVLLYFIFVLLIGIPAFIAELIIGRKAQRSAVGAYSELSKRSNSWRLLGWVNILTSLMILSYYSVIAGWTLNYTFMSLCQFAQNKTPEQIKGIFDILYKSADINLFWHFIFMLLTVGVVYGGIRKGIEYWSKILTPALLIFLAGLFLYTITLPGFAQSVKFIFYPDFSKLSTQGILQALGMSFFTLSVGLGIVLTYGSYMKPTENIPQTGIIVGAVSALVSLFAALMIFPIIFSFGLQPEEGPGLVFKTLPVLFSKLPGSLVISTIFFLLFVFTALTSSISLLEVVVSNLIEVFNWKRSKSVITAGIIAYILGIPSALAGSGKLFASWKLMFGKDFFGTIDEISADWLMPLGGFFAVVFAGWFLGKDVAKEEFLSGKKTKSFLKIWLFLIRYLAPVAILLVMLQRSGVIDINNLF
jgi:neurotransmitter:Na+ symporter, NSS family